jgi:hypothetical protein
MESNYSMIVYKEGSRVKFRQCSTKEEHDEFMIELLFDPSYPNKQLKSIYWWSPPAGEA